jgi:chromate reductase
VLVGQAHTKIVDGRLADEKSRQVLARHLAAFVDKLRA